MKRKILFVTTDLYPNLNTNSGIVYRLADILKNKYDQDVTILGYHRTKDASNHCPPSDIKTVYLKHYSEYTYTCGHYSNIFSRLFHLMLKPKCFLTFLRIKRGYKTFLVDEYSQYIKNYCKNNDVDCIVGFSKPEEALVALSETKSDVPYIEYKLDPWSTNYYARADNSTALKQEIEADRSASRIMVTDLIYKDYINTQREKESIDKLRVVNFPNIISNRTKGNDSKLFDDRKCNCVYAGGLYKDIRDPGYALRLFDELKEYNIVLHIFGCQASCPALPPVLPSNVIIHDRVSSGEADVIMNSADILVNIGNSAANQMPSKILTYIAAGKPILNIAKLQECPTLSYTDRYPLALNLLESGTISQETVKKAADFCLNNKGKTVPFETVEKSFYDCTPAYVGGQLMDVINESIEESRNGKAEEH